MELFGILQIIIGSIIVLFIPGFAWTFVFFSRNEIDVIERLALSFGLSIALVPLLVYYMNYLLGIKITFQNSIFAIIFLVLIPAGIYYARKKGFIPEKLPI